MFLCRAPYPFSYELFNYLTNRFEQGNRSPGARLAIGAFPGFAEYYSPRGLKGCQEVLERKASVYKERKSLANWLPKGLKEVKGDLVLPWRRA